MGENSNLIEITNEAVEALMGALPALRVLVPDHRRHRVHEGRQRVVARGPAQAARRVPRLEAVGRRSQVQLDLHGPGAAPISPGSWCVVCLDIVTLLDTDRVMLDDDDMGEMNYTKIGDGKYEVRFGNARVLLGTVERRTDRLYKSLATTTSWVAVHKGDEHPLQGERQNRQDAATYLLRERIRRVEAKKAAA